MEWEHRQKVETVRNHFGWNRLEGCHLADKWIYNYLENKSFDVEEAIAKIERRMVMEENEMLKYEVTDGMRQLLASGSAQIIGEATDGSCVMYVVTRREKPTSANRQERLKNADLVLNYASRLRPNSARSGTFTLLVNQKDASLWSNTDMSFTTTMAMRIAKYLPGAISKVVLVNMNGAITATLRPVVRALPRHLSEHVVILSAKERDSGKVFEYVPKEVVPVELGGDNDCDHPEFHQQFCDDVLEYFEASREARRIAVASFPRTKFTTYTFECVQQLVAAQQRQQQELEMSVMNMSGYSPRLSMSSTPGTLPEFFDCHTESELDDAATLSCYDADSTAIWVDPDAEPVITLCLRNAVIEEIHCRSMLIECAEERFADLVELQRTHARLCQEETFDHLAPERIASRCPTATAVLARVVLWFCCAVMAAQFTAAIVFILLFLLSLMMTLFLALFHTTLETAACAFALFTLGHQGALITCRGIQCISSTFHGRSIITFQRSSPWFGCWIQTGIWSVILALTSITFMLGSTRGNESLDASLRYGFAFGWMGCATALGVLHLIYPTPAVVEPAESKGRSNDIGLLSIYLLLDVDEDLENLPEGAAARRERRYRFMMRVILSVITLSLGLSHLSNNSAIETLVFSDIFAILTAIFSNYLLAFSPIRSDLTRHLMLTWTWMFAALWVYIVSGFGAMGLGESGNTTVAVLASVVGFYGCIVYAARWTRTYNRAWRPALKVGYLYLSCLVVIAVILTFVISWQLGLLATAMFLHCAACYSYRRRATDATSIAIVCIGVVVFSVIVVTLGHGMKIGEHTVPEAALQHTGRGIKPYPICTTHYGGPATPLTITDFAFFCHLAEAATPNILRQELETWFALYNLSRAHNFEERAGARVFIGDYNQTVVIAYRGTTDRRFAIQSMSLWLESMAFTPVSYILPHNWTSGLVDAASFLYPLLRFPHVQDEVVAWTKDTIDELRRETGNPNLQVYLTGYGFGGWLAQITATRLQINGIAFSAPGLKRTWQRFGLNWFDAVRFVVNVVPEGAPILDEHIGATQPVRCESTSAITCGSLTSITCELIRSCGTESNRSLTTC
eukprot:PhM_4_TR19062/c0_g1_i1/m.103255